MYTIGDLAIRIKNAVLARRKQVVLPYAKVAKNLADLLAKERYLRNVKVEEVEGKKIITAEVYYEKRIPFFTDVEIISKPSLRIYASSDDIAKRQKRSVGSLIISTNGGLMTGKDAIKKGVGGEVLFAIW